MQDTGQTALDMLLQLGREQPQAEEYLEAATLLAVHENPTDCWTGITALMRAVGRGDIKAAGLLAPVQGRLQTGDWEKINGRWASELAALSGRWCTAN